MPISSLVVQADEGHVSTLAAGVARIAGAHVTDVVGDQLIVVTETSHRDEDHGIWEQIRNLPHVISLDLTYHNFEDMEEDQHAVHTS